MFRLRGLLVAGLAGLVLAGLVAGCGGSDDKSATGPPARRSPPSAEVLPPRLPEADKAAYIQLTRASGALRAAAVSAAYGAPLEIATVNRLRDARRRVEATHPLNRQLESVRVRLVRSLQELETGGSRGVATQAIAAADRVDAGLRRFSSLHPAANELQPG